MKDTKKSMPVKSWTLPEIDEKWLDYNTKMCFKYIRNGVICVSDTKPDTSEPITGLQMCKYKQVVSFPKFLRRSDG